VCKINIKTKGHSCPLIFKAHIINALAIGFFMPELSNLKIRGTEILFIIYIKTKYRSISQ
jgi:hypothetical protein